MKFQTKMNRNMTDHLEVNEERLIPEPIYPEDWECCDNGCEELCVYEIYRIQKQVYDEQQKRLQAMNDNNKPML